MNHNSLKSLNLFWAGLLGFHSNIQSAYNSIAPKVDNLEKDVWKLRSVISNIEALNDENRKLGEQPKLPESDNSEVQ